MADERDVLEVLKFELTFLEQGGYGRSVHAPRTPTSIFQDSISCLNFGDPQRAHPCSECMLIDFVPQSARNEEVPCHHIPLSPAGETVATLEARDHQQKLEQAVITWLRAVIARMEKERQARSA
jgi:hypothetical protein